MLWLPPRSTSTTNLSIPKRKTLKSLKYFTTPRKKFPVWFLYFGWLPRLSVSMTAIQWTTLTPQLAYSSKLAHTTITSINWRSYLQKIWRSTLLSCSHVFSFLHRHTRSEHIKLLDFFCTFSCIFLKICWKIFFPTGTNGGGHRDLSRNSGKGPEHQRGSDDGGSSDRHFLLNSWTSFPPVLNLKVQSYSGRSAKKVCKSQGNLVIDYLK